jgi:hypothetical protein
MSDRLTDEQVAAAAAGTFVGDVQYLILDLAVEVQQARQRRCEKCVYWSSAWLTGGASGWCEGPPPCCHNETTPDYYCGNFTPR